MTEIEQSLQRCEELHARATALGHGDLELYYRDVRTLRLDRAEKETGFRVTRGVEDSIAVRTRSPGEGRAGFAACSGATATTLEWALRRAAEQHDRGSNVGEYGDWPPPAEVPLADHDAVEEPSVADLEARIGLARVALDRSPFSQRVRPVEETIEASIVHECWVAPGGFRASRVRGRGWTVLEVRVQGWSTPGGRPVVVARRRWPGLADSAWLEVLEDRLFLAQAPARPVTGKRDVLFAPEAAATLVEALVRTLCAPGEVPGRPVGPACRIADDPLDPEALFGGTFDDTGFPTARRQLADGRTTVGCFGGAGSLRRPSFRDPPTELPTHLIVAEAPDRPPDGAALAASVRIHAVGPDRWTLEIDGAELDGGRPATPFHATVATRPADLVERCAAAVGPARSFSRGVRTPALLFEGLSLDP